MRYGVPDVLEGCFLLFAVVVRCGPDDSTWEARTIVPATVVLVASAITIRLERSTHHDRVFLTQSSQMVIGKL